MIMNDSGSISNVLNLTESTDGVFIPHIVNIFEKHPWLFWTFLATVFLLVVSIVVLIVYCMVHNKKCFPCFRRYRTPEKKKFDLHRQNSASNMSPYGRHGPLPPLRSHLPPLNLPKKTIIPAITGINITMMKGIPEIDLAYDQHRPLPPIRPIS